MSIVFIISAPSGSGKSTLVERLMFEDRRREERRLQFSVSATTRPPRDGERDGEHYSFLSRDEFLRLRDNDELLEWAEVFGNFYGTTREVLRKAEQADRDLILDIDVQGAAQLREKLPHAVTIFILPPSRQVLESRLRNRSSDSDEVIERRLSEAAREVVDYEQYDYVLINDQLEDSFERLRGILLAERCRTNRIKESVQNILEGFRTPTTP
ncbi:MAG: guanylate kinase [Acidobacteria bacterium]|nr:guanylate kinase [Acidobacteriota bacterium]